MKYLDEYRDPDLAEKLIGTIRTIATRRWTLMDVCGGQTHGLVRNGIEQALNQTIELIHGPGCPVCVTPTSVIDFAIELSVRPNTTLMTFGDMLRVPGSRRSLMDARRDGGTVQIAYSPVDAVRYAEEHPDEEVVFLGIGFETTAPATAIAVMHAERKQIKNFSVIPAHVRVLPAMELIMSLPSNRVQGFLAAGHVCVITGTECYETFVRRHNVPVVVTGFEPIDLLEGILEAVRNLESGRNRVVNRYGRNVATDGNEQAMSMVNQVYAAGDAEWRGFGMINEGGLVLNQASIELKMF